ncbi:hypothetical protein SAMN02745121_04410 [Nannocystis exedens]|uniref:Uncharacterized protein n=1 Tax=Nannocystis exedens TaxID=54 RepID=A0A1I2AWW3_9BACT|nr:hypothetical protein [Nannocystis exedens]PCC74309.1 hypothetical protein NAEX_07398 [Nannocystis exedens]SFE48108.1 hypothetical protein SAMN02745121_04410 [Nannocystis exedens]
MFTRKLIVTLAGLVAVCALLSYAASERLGGLRGGATASAAAHSAGPGYGSYLQIAGVRPMDYDAANAGARRDGDAWVLGDVDLEAVRAAAAAPEDLDRLAEADPKWIPTQTWKMRHGGASPFAVAKEHCSARHLAQMEAMCKADISVVVERRSAGEGHVVYARPTLGDEATDDCHAYADCIARNAWLDRPAPLPDGRTRYHAFQAGDIRLPMHGTRDEWQVSLRSEIELVTANLTALRRLDLADPQIRQSLDLQQDLLEQLEWMAAL